MQTGSNNNYYSMSLQTGSNNNYYSMDECFGLVGFVFTVFTHLVGLQQIGASKIYHSSCPFIKLYACVE